MTRARDNANLGVQAGSGLDASDITTGVLPVGVTGGSGLNALGTIGSGTLSSGVTGGSGLNALSASNLSAGTVADARMPNLTGDVTTVEGAVATSITDDAVTGGKLANDIAITTTGAIRAPGVPVFLTRKHLTSNFTVTTTQTASDLTYTYTYPASHKLWIFGGFTCVGSSSDFHSHWIIYVDGGRVFSPDQHNTPQPWWHQGFAFTTGDLSSSQHVITVTGHAQSGGWYAVGDETVSQINYMAIPN